MQGCSIAYNASPINANARSQDATYATNGYVMQDMPLLLLVLLMLVLLIRRRCSSVYNAYNTATATATTATYKVLIILLMLMQDLKILIIKCY